MNLVILYPHYLFGGNLISMTTGADGYSGKNVVTGARSLFFKASTNVSSVDFYVDIDTLSEAEQAPDYLYIGGLNLSIAKGGLVNVELNGDDDSAFPSPTLATGQADVALTDLVGRRNEDLILETTDQYTKRYWHARIENGTGTSDFQYMFRKLYFGKWWYPDVEPSTPANQRLNISNNRRHGRAFSFTWYGITNAKLKEFINNIYIHKRYNPVVLYAREWTDILNGETVINAMITNYELKRIMHDVNQIRVDFVEVI